MIKVKMLTNIAGQPPHYAGEIVDKDDEVARAWIKDGLAVRAESAKA